MFSVIIPHKLSRPEWLAFSFGSMVFSGILFAALLKRLLIPVNITGAVGFCVILLIGVAALLRTRLERPGLAGFGIIAFSSISFVVSVVNFLRDDGAYDRDFVLHKISLSLVCPIFYLAGSIYARLGTRRVFAYNLIHATLLASCLAFLQAVLGEPSPLHAQTVGSYYQYAGDALVLSFILWLALSSGSLPVSIQISSFVFGLFVLLFLGSRGSVVLFLASLAVLLCVNGGGVRLIYISVLGIALVSLLFWSGLNIRIFDRIHDFIESGYVDTSLSERLEYSRNALVEIFQNPMFGNFGYDYPGARYAHNMLDVWANFGLIIFAFFLAPVFRGCSLLFGMISQTRLALLSVLLTYILVALAFFRHPENILIFFAMGFLGVFAVTASSGVRVLTDDCKCPRGDGS